MTKQNEEKRWKVKNINEKNKLNFYALLSQQVNLTEDTVHKFSGRCNKPQKTKQINVDAQ